MEECFVSKEGKPNNEVSLIDATWLCLTLMHALKHLDAWKLILKAIIEIECPYTYLGMLYDTSFWTSQLLRYGLICGNWCEPTMYTHVEVI